MITYLFKSLYFYFYFFNKDNVIEPRKTTIDYELNDSSLLQSISLQLEQQEEQMQQKSHLSQQHSLLKTVSSTNGGFPSTSTEYALQIISNNILQQQMSNKSVSPLSPLSSPSLLINGRRSGSISGEDPNNIWKKRNLENSINLPHETQTKSMLRHRIFLFFF
jgi:hypothetical protein